MVNRRKFLTASGLGYLGILLSSKTGSAARPNGKPIVISTWDAGIEANKGAWEVLKNGGRALDAVESGVMVTEASRSCCVGLGANPDREGIVTLDASIMDESFNCGSVAFLERIKHPISVARRVMEKTPHVMLVGTGAQQFAIAEGFPLEEQKLSPNAQKAYDEWLKNSQYHPVINIENKPLKGPNASIDDQFIGGNEFNHDTIGMLAMDAKGNLSGSCTTSGMGFKMRGRLGDSPIIGAGLYVDNGTGACVATGQGEEVIRIAGSHLVVEFMRQGMTPFDACKKAIQRIIQIRKEKAKEFQVAFIAINKSGETGSFAIQKDFSYAIRSAEREELVKVDSIY